MKKKILIALLLVVFALSVTLAACAHTHTFSEEWEYDDTYHWHPATCEHSEEQGDKEEHSFVDGVCKCGFEQGSQGTATKSNNGFTWEVYSNEGSSGGTGSSDLPRVPSGKADTPSVQIHYKRTNASEYGDWYLWLWSDSGVASSEPGWAFNYQDDYGAVALYSFSQLGLSGVGDKLGFLVRKPNWAAKDVEADRFWTIPEPDENNYCHLYLNSGDPKLYDAPDGITYGITAAFKSETSVAITTATPIKHIKLLEGTNVLAETDTDQTVTISYTMQNGKKPDLNKDYKVEATFVSENRKCEESVSIIALYDSETFANAYNYEGELGAIYSANSTEFKVWSPVSGRITLNIYQSGHQTETPETHEMTKGDKGVFSVTVNGDLAGKYYTYTVYNSTYPTGMEIVDPYAKSAGLNGKRGQIVNFAETNPEGWDQVSPLAIKANELVVWETHVADVTSSATWNGPAAHAKKFLGLIDTGTTLPDNPEITTGFDHIKELGINAMQLVPIFDQANDETKISFNWGYNPLNYNVLEGGYSSNAEDGYVRINEFKQVVKAYSEAGINIIMDVVYNHVSSAVGSNFDVLCPGYYFRYTANGDMANGSGCGNETASNHFMFRKFMIDSVCFWAKEYKLGGFRFDLMGLHDIDTMNQLVVELKKINPNIIVYGEPWQGGTSPYDNSKLGMQVNGNKFEGFGQFNDKMRDALIKGGLSAATEVGWANSNNTNDVQAIVAGLKGFTASSPAINDLFKTVNYVTCHDNYTLYDRMMATETMRFPRDISIIIPSCMLANSVVLTSNGINFMLAGEEFLRSKELNGAKGDAIHNSYESSYKVNELDYSLKEKHFDIFQNYVKLINFKKMFVNDFGLETNEDVAAKYQVEALKNGNLIAITITAKDGSVWKVFHAHGFADPATTVDTLNLEGYTLYLDTLGKYENAQALTSTTNIVQRQTIIAHKAA